MDFSQDKKIWNNEKDYFIEVNEFDITKPTQLPKGTELTVYNESTQVTVMTCFASPNGIWISY